MFTGTRFCGVVLSCLLVLSIAETGVYAQTPTKRTRLVRPNFIRNYTPPVWQEEDVQWGRDVDPHNYIDDEIDASDETLFDVVINFKRCVEDDDIEYLNNVSPTSSVQFKLKAITSVAVKDLTKSDMESIISDIPGVAFIEGQWGFSAALNYSLQNLKVIGSTCYGTENFQEVYPDVMGEGVTIAILDTGVDNPVDGVGGHRSFRGVDVVGCYDAVNNSLDDPDDHDGHGTYIASIVLGQSILIKNTTVSRGVAPAASLIDIKVLETSEGGCDDDVSWGNVLEGIELLLEKMENGDWQPDVILFALYQCLPGGGLGEGELTGTGYEAICQLFNEFSGQGVTVVTAAGNNGPGNAAIPSPAAALRAITVAASDDRNSCDRGISLIADFSNRGPVFYDPVHDYNPISLSNPLNRMKPDVAAPGVNILAADINDPTGATAIEKSGTSAAAAHVAGVAALLIEAAGRLGREPNPASIKDALTSTADRHGPPYFEGFEWNRAWGWGLIDAYKAATYGISADLGFPSHPAEPDWLSPDIKVKRSNWPEGHFFGYFIEATIRNNSVNVVPGFWVETGIHDMEASIPTFYIIDRKYVEGPVYGGEERIVNVFYQPQTEGHLCAQVEIGYGFDTDYSNNIARRNFDHFRSPVTFKVRNILTEEPVTIEFVPTFEFPEAGWELEINPPSVTLAADDCPAEIEVELLPPPDALPGSEQIVHIAAVVGDIELGGVSLMREIPFFPKFRIEKIHNAFQGHFVDVSITVENSNLAMGGFDFLIGYDAIPLAFVEAEPGQLLEDCGWEYFTYRHGVEGNCGDACPSGLLRIIALAETTNGANHPSCFGPPDTDPHELARLTFFVTNDRTFNCQYVPIYFFWDDCGDNSVSSVDGQNLYIDRAIYDFEGNLIWDEDDDDQYPEDARIPFVGAPDYCLNSNPEKPSPERLIDFVNGGIDIICSDSIDAKGDINCDGIPWTIADAVAFVRCLMNFPTCTAASIAASDCNGDGIPLSIADLVYLIRVIVGDAMPDPKVLPRPLEVGVSLQVNHSAVAVAVSSAVDIGGGYFEFEHTGYEIGVPHLINGASDMTLKYGDENGVLKVLVYSMEKDRKVPAGTEHIFAVPISGEGTIALSEVELSDYFGNLLTTRIDAKSTLPATYAMHQNYPNPFNATTTIMYELPINTHVTISVFNAIGQKVATLVDREEEAGIHSVAWEGVDQSGSTVASGVYIYRISTSDFTTEKKMILMK